MAWAYCSGGDVTSTVRALVAQTYNAEPARVELAHHRQVPEARLNGKRIEVSISRSHGYLAVACADPGENCGLGIDIEAVRPFLDSATEPVGFADVVLAPDEFAWFRRTTESTQAQRLAWLLRTWVRKEAVLKSLHTGFDTSRGGLPPAAVMVSEPWEQAVCLSHPQTAVTDLPTGENGPVILAAARNAEPTTVSSR